MAADAGARMALVGHSERRQLFGESPEGLDAPVEGLGDDEAALRRAAV